MRMNFKTSDLSFCYEVCCRYCFVIRINFVFFFRRQKGKRLLVFISSHNTQQILSLLKLIIFDHNCKLFLFVECWTVYNIIYPINFVHINVCIELYPHSLKKVFHCILTLCKSVSKINWKLWKDFNESLRKSWQCAKEQLIKFWWCFTFQRIFQKPKARGLWS